MATRNIKAGGGNRTRMTSLEGCTPPVINSIDHKDLAIPENQSMPKSMPCTHENDTDLAYLVESWPGLPEHIKAAIKALIDAHQKRPPNTPTGKDNPDD